MKVARQRTQPVTIARCKSARSNKSDFHKSGLFSLACCHIFTRYRHRNLQRPSRSEIRLHNYRVCFLNDSPRCRLNRSRHTRAASSFSKYALSMLLFTVSRLSFSTRRKFNSMAILFYQSGAASNVYATLKKKGRRRRRRRD